MNTEDLLKLLPEADQIKDSLEKSLRQKTLKASSKNGLVTAVINYQQEITDLIIDNRLLASGKSGALRTSLIEALNLGIKNSRNKMLEEAARAMKLF